MNVQKIRRNGNSYAVTITREEMERLGLNEGDFVSVEVRKMDLRPVLSPELRAAMDRSWARAEGAYRYLAEH